MEIQDTEILTFNISFAAAKLIVAALGKLPMETVEPLVADLRGQVEKHLAEKQARTDKPAPIQGELVN